MALYVEVDFDIGVYDTSAKDNVYFRHQIKDKTHSEADFVELDGGGRIPLAASASDVAVNFQSIGDGKLVVLKSTSEFTVKINGTGESAITLTPQTNGASEVLPAFLCMQCSGVTSLHLGNPSSTDDVEVEVGIGGTET